MWGLTQICAQTKERKNDLKLQRASWVKNDLKLQRSTLASVPQMGVMIYLLPLTSILGAGRKSRWFWAVLLGSTGLPRTSTHALEKDSACARIGGRCLGMFSCSTEKYPRNGQECWYAWRIPGHLPATGRHEWCLGESHLSTISRSSCKGCLLVQTSQGVGVETDRQHMFPVGS